MGYLRNYSLAFRTESGASQVFFGLQSPRSIDLGRLGSGRPRFDATQLASVREAVALAEELTSEHFRYSTSQWRRCRYDILTAEKLSQEELTDEAFAQILRYVGVPSSGDLKSTRFDFYKICLQDHVILEAIRRERSLGLFPLVLYVVVHELVHIVRFSLFLQSFDAPPEDRQREEMTVHAITRDIIRRARNPAVELVAREYWERMKARGTSLEVMGEGFKR